MEDVTLLSKFSCFHGGSSKTVSRVESIPILKGTEQQQCTHTKTEEKKNNPPHFKECFA